MRQVFLITVAAALSLAGVSSATAQTAPKTAAPFSELLHSGFKIVSAFIFPGDGASDNSAKNPPVTVTLIKETSVAVCVVSLGGYQTLGTAKWTDDAGRCDVRTF